MKEYMKAVLKGKNSLEAFTDKVKTSGAAAAPCPSTTCHMNYKTSREPD